MGISQLMINNNRNLSTHISVPKRSHLRNIWEVGQRGVQLFRQVECKQEKIISSPALNSIRKMGNDYYEIIRHPIHAAI